MNRNHHKPGSFTSIAVVNALIEQHADALDGFRRIALKAEDGAGEAVHKARVTTRRLQAVADLLEYGPEADRVRVATKRLRKFRASLSLLRNYNVFLGIVERAKEKSGPAELPGLELLENHLELRRDGIALKARRRLKEFDAAGLKDDLLWRGRGDVEDPGTETVQKIRERIKRRLNTRKQEFLSLLERLQQGPDIEDLHQLRIAAKRLRYLLESVGALGYREPKAALLWLRSLQRRIGDWHDLQALEQEIIRIVRKRGFLVGQLREGSQLLEAGWLLVKQKDVKAGRAVPLAPSRQFLASMERAVQDVGQGLEESR
jgi:CHAD domain-containing protein